jgi:ribosomal protein S19
MNDYDATVQGVESDVNEYNIINGVINTSSIIPEYLNIDFIIKDGEKTAQVYIDVV